MAAHSQWYVPLNIPRPGFLICALLRRPLTKNTQFLSPLIRRGDLLCDNGRPNHDSARSHFGERSEAIGKSRISEEACRPITLDLYCFHWCQRLSGPWTNAFAAGLAHNSQTCSVQPSNHVVHTNRFSRSPVTLAAAYKSVILIK